MGCVHEVRTNQGLSPCRSAWRIFPCRRGAGPLQPALSEQVRQLELHYDLLLFRRQNRRVELTDRGRDLFQLTSRFFENESAIASFLVGASARLRGSLRIMVDSTAHATAPLREFRAHYPDIRLHISHGNSQEVLEALRAYEAEIGIFGSQRDAGDLTMVKIGLSLIIAIAGPTTFSRPRTKSNFSGAFRRYSERRAQKHRHG